MTDDEGATDITTQTVSVSNIGPNADFSYTPGEPSTADAVRFTSQSSDQDGFIDGYSWDFDDGGTDEGTGTAQL